MIGPAITPRYVLGIDQGSTKTHAVVCTSTGEIVGIGHAGGGYAMHDMAAALHEIARATDMARTQAALGDARIELLYGGITSADWPDEYLTIQSQLAALELAGTTEVTNDCLVALRGGTAAAAAAIISAGTGGNCAVRSPSGETWVYGYYHDDELQGGIALGEQALWAVYRAHTGRAPATLLTDRILHHYALTTVDALRRAHCERFDHHVIKQLAPLVFHAARDGDTAATLIIQRLGTGLAGLVSAGLQRFAMLHHEVDVVLSGSIFKGPGDMLQRSIQDALQDAAPRALLVEARYEPVVGAVLLGLERLGVALTPDVEAAIERTSRHHGLLRHPTPS